MNDEDRWEVWDRWGTEMILALIVPIGLSIASITHMDALLLWLTITAAIGTAGVACKARALYLMMKG